MPTKVRLVKAMVCPVVMYRCQSWAIKKAESHLFAKGRNSFSRKAIGKAVLGGMGHAGPSTILQTHPPPAPSVRSLHPTPDPVPSANSHLATDPRKARTLPLLVFLKPTPFLLLLCCFMPTLQHFQNSERLNHISCFEPCYPVVHSQGN